MQTDFPVIYPVACHTDNIGVGSTYVVIRGDNVDGVQFIPLAIKKGANRILVEHDVILSDEISELITQHAIEVVRVENARKALAEYSASAAGFPAKKLSLLAITGTKGKTTTAWITYHILKSAGKKVALISTVVNKIGDVSYSSSLTTPHPDYLHQFFLLCVKKGIEYVVMETAAQAVTLYRSFGLVFDGFVFTNFAQEHGEFYNTQEDYFAAKCALFNQVATNGFIGVNADESQLIQAAPQGSRFFGKSTHADFVIGKIKDAQELQFNFTYKNTEYTVNSNALAGEFNAYNVVAACALAQCSGVDLQLSCDLMSSFAGVPGRLQKIYLKNGALGIVDYAHNPSSYNAVLPVVRSLTDHLIVIFGCGGKRDKVKRPLMGALATQYADIIILTSDNPRTEDPLAICHDIQQGISYENHKKVIVELDRKKAIEKAYTLSKKGTVIALFGKGPDEFQIIGDKKSFFSDFGILQSL